MPRVHLCLHRTHSSGRLPLEEVCVVGNVWSGPRVSACLWLSLELIWVEKAGPEPANELRVSCSPLLELSAV